MRNGCICRMGVSIIILMRQCFEENRDETEKT